MKALFLVFIGGGLGSSIRFYFSLLQNIDGLKWIPTLSVNILGCLLLGCFIAAFQKEQLAHHWYVLLGIGFCGGLTTFSTFSVELFLMLKTSDYYSAFLYLFLSIILGILAAGIGYYLIEKLVLS